MHYRRGIAEAASQQQYSSRSFGAEALPQRHYCSIQAPALPPRHCRSSIAITVFKQQDQRRLIAAEALLKQHRSSRIDAAASQQ